MVNLTELILDDNAITQMPPEIAQLTALVKFSANNNKIATLANVPGITFHLPFCLFSYSL
jgi:Leucine-rich repeat (LRR) protein